MRFLAAAALALVAGCSPPLIVESYAWDKDQLIVLHSSARPAQVFFRGAGDEGWTATSSSTLEAAPPNSGLWDLELTDWTVLNLGEGRIQVRQPGECRIEEWEISRIATRVSVKSCDRPDTSCNCAPKGAIWLDAGAEECHLPAEWNGSVSEELCIRVYR